MLTRAPNKSGRLLRTAALIAGLAVPAQAVFAQETQSMNQTATETPASDSLSVRQQAIIPVAAFAAAGDIRGLNSALNEGLDAGMTISDAREVLVQLYAYAGFPRSLNALGELMKVVEQRKQQGIADAPGSEPSKAAPKGDALLQAGTANQTELVGATVAGPLFDFAPVANEYLRTHLFGDIFERDNLDWQSRELATVAMLSSISGAQSQLKSHIGMSMNTGVTEAQLRQLIDVLASKVGQAQSEATQAALEQHLSAN
ncbi:MAG TPA: carboxymuconolactone decarboxylase [Pseudomonas sp.]|nr:carboxymuconolactone decarboxylase [Pseudomonadales bacterium]HCL40853.1 carboxymuconolactone decarboxylase [Pseudomonas sp.]|tara:strand:+ start:10153 stop:10926 length:774 start_codon:yes stop_codon:yes gene_type:complete